METTNKSEVSSSIYSEHTSILQLSEYDSRNEGFKLVTHRPFEGFSLILNFS